MPSGWFRLSVSFEKLDGCISRYIKRRPVDAVRATGTLKEVSIGFLVRRRTSRAIRTAASFAGDVWKLWARRGFCGREKPLKSKRRPAEHRRERKAAKPHSTLLALIPSDSLWWMDEPSGREVAPPPQKEKMAVPLTLFKSGARYLFYLWRYICYPPVRPCISIDVKAKLLGPQRRKRHTSTLRWWGSQLAKLTAYCIPSYPAPVECNLCATRETAGNSYQQRHKERAKGGGQEKLRSDWKFRPALHFTWADPLGRKRAVDFRTTPSASKRRHALKDKLFNSVSAQQGAYWMRIIYIYISANSRCPTFQLFLPIRIPIVSVITLEKRECKGFRLRVFLYGHKSSCSTKVNLAFN